MRVNLRSSSAAVVLLLLPILVSVGAGASGTDTRLANAVEQRDAKAIADLLKRHVDVNVPQPDGATALHWAAHWNDLSTAKGLISAGARVNAPNDYGVTPLFLGATNGSADMLGLLLDAGANANAALPSGETVLMTAVTSGSLAAVKRLLASGANPNVVQVSKGQTALMWAATRQKPEIVRALLEKGADGNARSASGFTPLMFAAREGSLEVSRLLLTSNADVNATASDGSTPLLVATVRGHAKLAMLLLEQGAHPDGSAGQAGYTPLHWAVSRFEDPITNSALDPPGEWQAMTGIPDRDAKLALIKALLAHGAALEARVSKAMPTPTKYGGAVHPGATPFFVAATVGDAEVMRLLLASGADPLARASDGSTALMAVIAGGNAYGVARVTEKDRIDAIQVALDAGNDLEAQDNKGYRAMHVAAGAEFHGIITFLLEKGADLNPVTKSRTEKEGAGTVVIVGQSPLGIVEGTFNGGTYNERPDTAEFLRKLGAKSIGRATLQSYIKSFEEVKPPTADGEPRPQGR